MRVLVIHGPNLNLLGKREPQVYGSLSLQEIDQRIRETAKSLGVEVEARQTNEEARIIEWIQEAADAFDAIVINPAGFTHTSVAIRDAIAAAGVPTVEVHLSNIHAREPFRQHSFISPVVHGQITGFGAESYTLGLRAAVALVSVPPEGS